MNKGIVLLIGLSILAAVPYFYDNTDNGVWSEEDKILVASMQKVYEQKEAERMANLGPTLEATANVCLNGKKPSSLTYEQNVNEFIKGPCSPVVLLPGIMGTSLQVKIDCELLWGENPEIFSNCGWGTCSWSIFKSRPSAEYRLWISTTTNPVAAIVRNKKDRCFGDIIQQIYDPTQKDPKDRYKNPYGLEVTWHGNTDETKSTSECGLRGVYEITDDILIKASMCDEQGFQSMRDLFLNMGYISGLTLQAIPYDWRKSIVASDSQKNIATSLENLYKIIGKKSYIIAHSLGSLHSTNVLYNMEQSKKDQIVAGVVTMGGPMLGAPKILKGALGGDDAFVSHIFALGDVGVNYHSQSMITNSASSLQDLQIKDTYFRHRTQPWMQELLKRVELENQYLSTKQFPSDNYPLSWFPSPKEICGAGFEARPNECLLLVQDLSEPFLFVKDKVYNASEDSIHSSLIDNSVQATSERVWQFFQEAKRPLADQLAHPGVPMIVIYGAHSMVPSKFTYNNNPRDVIGSTEEFYFPEKSETSQGDATVLTSSAITTAIKWIYEHNNGQTKYPTKLVEYCSEFKQGSVYDGTDAQGQKLIQSSEVAQLGSRLDEGLDTKIKSLELTFSNTRTDRRRLNGVLERVIKESDIKQMTFESMLILTHTFIERLEKSNMYKGVDVFMMPGKDRDRMNLHFRIHDKQPFFMSLQNEFNTQGAQLTLKLGYRNLFKIEDKLHFEYEKQLNNKTQNWLLNWNINTLPGAKIDFTAQQSNQDIAEYLNEKNNSFTLKVTQKNSELSISHNMRSNTLSNDNSQLSQYLNYRYLQHNDLCPSKAIILNYQKNLKSTIKEVKGIDQGRTGHINLNIGLPYSCSPFVKLQMSHQFYYPLRFLKEHGEIFKKAQLQYSLNYGLAYSKRLLINDCFRNIQYRGFGGVVPVEQGVRQWDTFFKVDAKVNVLNEHMRNIKLFYYGSIFTVGQPNMFAKNLRGSVGVGLGMPITPTINLEALVSLYRYKCRFDKDPLFQIRVSIDD